MAFDLNNFLQENKRFLLGAFVGGAVFVTGYTVIDAYVWDDIRVAAHEIGSDKSKVNKEDYFSQKNLDEAKAQEEKLNQSIKALTAKLAFVSRAEFQLKDGGASPQNQYLDIASRFREKRLDDARSRGIDICDNCGVPDRSPTQAEDIRRTLRGLDLADRVIECAIGAGVREIKKITVAADAQFAGREDSYIRDEVKVEFEIEANSRALSAMIELTQASNPPLTIDEFSSDVRDAGSSGRAGRGESLVHIQIKFAAIEVKE
ncbi:MAG: hypothetical protein HY286_03445 [Planctomycetes bacterium]|nr:hypothetical protein [Planctomycetota bacterium]